MQIKHPETCSKNLVLSVSNRHVGGIYTVFEQVSRQWSKSGISHDFIHDYSIFDYYKLFTNQKSSTVIWSLSHEASLLPLLLSFLFGNRNIYFNHGIWSLESSQATWYLLGKISKIKRGIHYFKLIIKQNIVLLLTGKVIHPSNYAMRLFREYKPFFLFKHKEGAIIHLGSDPNLYRYQNRSKRKKLKQKYGCDSDGKLLLMTGRADNRKNIQDGIRILSMLSRSHKHVTLLYSFAMSKYSDYNYLGFLSEQVNKLCVGSKVKFITGLSTKELSELFQIADVTLVLPIHSEMFGLMALDSLMSGTPVYGYETTATPELLGTLAPKYLVSKSRLKLLVKNIEQYLFQTNPDEVELIRRQTAKDARTVFSWHKTGKRMFSYCAMDK